MGRIQEGRKWGFFLLAVAIASACFDCNSAAIFSPSQDILFIKRKALEDHCVFSLNGDDLQRFFPTATTL